MDSVSPPTDSDDRVVLLAAAEGELLAMCALMLEMAGFRVLPLAGLVDVVTRAREVRPYGIVADVRRGDTKEWDAIRRLRADPLTCAARIVVVIDGSQAIPAEVAGQRGVAILQWPFPVTDVLQSLLAP